jgi:choline dehydrogenase-like flavoprotein
MVDLDPAIRDVFGQPVPRVTYAQHAYEKTSRVFYVPFLRQVVMNAGATSASAFVAPCDAFFGSPPVSRHVMGTLRMGNDAATSVVDAGGRFHDLDNLYACDGSVFPTASGYNPTLTIFAVAAKIAHGLAGTTPSFG